MAEPRTSNRLDSVWAFTETKAGGIQSAGGDPVTMRRHARSLCLSADSGRTADIPDCLFGVSPLSLRLSVTAAPPPEAHMTARTSQRWAGPLTGSLERAGREKCERARVRAPEEEGGAFTSSCFVARLPAAQSLRAFQENLKQPSS